MEKISCFRSILKNRNNHPGVVHNVPWFSNEWGASPSPGSAPSPPPPPLPRSVHPPRAPYPGARYSETQHPGDPGNVPPLPPPERTPCGPYQGTPFPGTPYPAVPGTPYPAVPGTPYPAVPGTPYPSTPYRGAPYPDTPYPGAPGPVLRPGPPEHTPRTPYPGAPYSGAPYPDTPYPGAPGPVARLRPPERTPCTPYPGVPYQDLPYPNTPYPPAPGTVLSSSGEDIINGIIPFVEVRRVSSVAMDLDSPPSRYSARSDPQSNGGSPNVRRISSSSSRSPRRRPDLSKLRRFSSERIDGLGKIFSPKGHIGRHRERAQN